ncbi:MAG: HAD family phosphatase [Verrucomicrobiota bacterium JB023]|nr:HAD family phosphatase [Verrucomicrobiota bacterium JB023]
MKFEAILFDFDGTLMDTEWAIYQAWLRTFQAHGHDLPVEVYVQCIGSDFATWSPKTHLEDLTGTSFDWHDLDTGRQREIEADLADQGAMPGAEAVLAQLAPVTRLAVVSSSSHQWVDGWLQRHSLESFFETTVCRGDAPRIKPAPDLYLEAARQLELDPASCLVIEDSFNGMKAAHAAGMDCWVIPNRITKVSDFSEAEQVFHGISEVASSFDAKRSHGRSSERS